MHSTSQASNELVHAILAFLKGIPKNREQNMKLTGLAPMAGAVIQATGRTESEDGTRPGGRLKRLHAHGGWHGSGGRGYNSHARPNSNCHSPGIIGV